MIELIADGVFLIAAGFCLGFGAALGWIAVLAIVERARG